MLQYCAMVDEYMLRCRGKMLWRLQEFLCCTSNDVESGRL